MPRWRSGSRARLGKPFVNQRVRDAVEPASARHAPAARKTVAGEPHPADAEFLRVFHQNAENGWMQMQMQMAVDVVERQAGGAEFFKLRVDFGPELFAQAALEKITEAGGDGVVQKIRRAG